MKNSSPNVFDRLLASSMKKRRPMNLTSQDTSGYVFSQTATNMTSSPVLLLHNTPNNEKNVPLKAKNASNLSHTVTVPITSRSLPNPSNHTSHFSSTFNSINQPLRNINETGSRPKTAINNFGRMHELTQNDVEAISEVPTANVYPGFHGEVLLKLPTPMLSETKMQAGHVKYNPHEVQALRAMRGRIRRTKKKLQTQSIPKEGVFDIAFFMPPAPPL
ncbi:hypothetical protein TRFO_09525 [Tritrichomonas foetus]|uniref:Uncharacterized protein n=1 Tax=Tritrichomonas foetus TaxID=1144522 RepID=A0A1J4JIB0_9EUKA|nr:hypothetical protein TRFO_09525 [Tritrichomonas foetus]|eukprot:OHS97261.1 hypothetical protein TRFO_09525 [Tritrichomonas foetus]